MLILLVWPIYQNFKVRFPIWFSNNSGTLYPSAMLLYAKICSINMEGDIKENMFSIFFYTPCTILIKYRFLFQLQNLTEISNYFINIITRYHWTQDPKWKTNKEPYNQGHRTLNGRLIKSYAPKWQNDNELCTQGHCTLNDTV